MKRKELLIIRKLFCWQCKKDLGDNTFQNFAKVYKGYSVTGHRKFFCDEECYNKYWNRFYFETYKGNKIYKVNVCGAERFIPYIGCFYYFTTIEECRNRIDTPNIACVNDDLFKTIWDQF